eukprot:GILK01000914.1.p1 GENE.GILK01000914.1~~GILK01000914.1.p1  ORF type:complete len:407 (-),score=38.71 GILK01000914.1:131-1303(-)
MSQRTAFLLLCVIACAWAADDLPTNFDSRVKWPGCVRPVLNQNVCGSCYAFSTASAAADRMCINTGGAFMAQLSPQSLVSCSSVTLGCKGGNTYLAARYVVTDGLEMCDRDCTGGCRPYLSAKCREEDDAARDGCTGWHKKCPSTCADNSPAQRYVAKDWHMAKLPLMKLNEQALRREIFENGPVVASFDVYTDFSQFFAYHPQGVYSKTSGAEKRGGHAVKVVGWGVEASTNTPYWLIQNSWGPDWGDSGFFRMKRGNNECNIEDQMVYVQIGSKSTTAGSLVADAFKRQVLEDPSLLKGYEVGWVELNPRTDVALQHVASSCARRLKHPVFLSAINALDIVSAASHVVAGVQYRMVMQLAGQMENWEAFEDLQGNVSCSNTASFEESM